MANEFHERLDVCGERMAELNMELVTYSDGNQQRELAASPAAQTQAELAAGGVIVASEGQQDFIFATSDLTSNGFFPPRRGQTIQRPNGELHEVTAIDDQTYRFVTSSHKRIRVHATRVTFEQ